MSSSSFLRLSLFGLWFSCFLCSFFSLAHHHFSSFWLSITPTATTTSISTCSPSVSVTSSYRPPYPRHHNHPPVKDACKKRQLTGSTPPPLRSTFPTAVHTPHHRRKFGATLCCPCFGLFLPQIGCWEWFLGFAFRFHRLTPFPLHHHLSCFSFFLIFLPRLCLVLCSFLSSMALNNWGSHHKPPHLRLLLLHHNHPTNHSHRRFLCCYYRTASMMLSLFSGLVMQSRFTLVLVVLWASPPRSDFVATIFMLFGCVLVICFSFLVVLCVSWVLVCVVFIYFSDLGEFDSVRSLCYSCSLLLLVLCFISMGTRCSNWVVVLLPYMNSYSQIATAQVVRSSNPKKDAESSNQVHGFSKSMIWEPSSSRFSVSCWLEDFYVQMLDPSNLYFFLVFIRTPVPKRNDLL